MKTFKDVHVQFTPEHYEALKRIANERGMGVATLIRSVVIEHLQLNELAERAGQEPATAAN